ncbi:glycosyl transferase [Nitratireductor aestuarii]|uniref:Glycosyl transferase n=1 Tax=Nitratireductor aestuarii TaxID=1735103 RepID=A0A916REV4_9HYPH|nr:glycosyltransferase [Nitratireductor aestuarii]GGA53503.1 glycosyl transferase [Nitratireductor aestuarii]
MQQAVRVAAEIHPHEPAAGCVIDPNKRVAIVHDWCPDFRGGERVLARLCKLFPGADVFTLFDFLKPEIKAEHFPGVRFETSVANRLPGVRRYYRHLFHFCPFLIEQFDVTRYDLVISSSAAFSRGVLTRPDQPHISYVHSPVRYAWDEQFSYLDQAKLGLGPKGLLVRWMLHRLRMWDARTAHGPDLMLANSNYVRRRIGRIYGRDADVVFPPVAVDEMPFRPVKDDYYVTASFLAPYKRTDLVIKAFRAMPHLKLVVVGEGQQLAQLKELQAPNIQFTGYLARDEYVNTIAGAKAMVFAGCEDFGIALAEAQASGTPLIAFGRGGAVDIVRPLGSEPNPTGVLFAHQTEEAIIRAVGDFERSGHAIRPEACRMNAERFSEEAFDEGIRAAVRTVQATFAGTAGRAMTEAESIAAISSR